MSITNKEQFIKSIINDFVCVPSKAMREIFNDNWKHVDNAILYSLIIESMYSLNNKFKLLTNLNVFADEDLRNKINAYIKCRKYEYNFIKKKTSNGAKFIYNVYSMKYHEEHSDQCFEEMSNDQGQCYRFIGTAVDLDSARMMVILDHEVYKEDEEETHHPCFQLFYMVAKNIIFKEEYEDLDCPYGNIFFDKNGNVIDIFIYDFRIDSVSEKKYPILDDDEPVLIDGSYFAAKCREKFSINKKVKVYNSLYTRELCDVVEKDNYIIGYLEENSFC